LLICGVLLFPFLLAVWVVPWFVTQDGPLSVYNTYVLREVSKGNDFLATAYAERGSVVPYLGGHKLLTLLLAIFPARTADRLMMTFSLLGIVASLFWLRRRLTGWTGIEVILPLVVLLAGTRLWLLGLNSFLLGACVFPLGLGLWWKWRDELNVLRAALLAALLVAGYFFHIIGAAFTVVGIGILAVATPTADWRKRLTWSTASLAPVLLFILGFGASARQSGKGATWDGLTGAGSADEWLQYIQSPDFISFSFKTRAGGLLSIATDCPFVSEPSSSYAVLGPSLWAAVGLMLLIAAAIRHRGGLGGLRRSYNRGWMVLILVLAVVGLFGPSSIAEGSLLRERVMLFSVMTVMSVVRVDAGHYLSRACRVCLFVGVALQAAFVWDYALISNRIAGQVMAAAPHVGTRKRVGLVLADPRTQYLINPLPNIANQLGVDASNIVWNNYEPNYYYFPITFRDGTAETATARILLLNELFISGEAEQFAAKDPRRFESAVSAGLDETDVLIVWGRVPWFDAFGSKWFQSDPVFESGLLRVFTRK